MKRMTASEARRNWFRLLDQVLEGEVFTILRRGQRIVVRLEPTPEDGEGQEVDYAEVLKVPDVDRADGWSWEWEGPEGALRSADRAS